MKKVFDHKGEWAATYAAEAWCRENGISVGTMERGFPRGLKRGDCYISKWRNLDDEDKAELDGTMTGNGRNGPITIELNDEAGE